MRAAYHVSEDIFLEGFVARSKAGTSSLEPALINAAANIATALSTSEKKGSIVLAVSEANSLGLALLMKGSSNTLGKALQGGSKQAIVLENFQFRSKNLSGEPELLPREEGVVADVVDGVLDLGAGPVVGAEVDLFAVEAQSHAVAVGHCRQRSRRNRGVARTAASTRPAKPKPS